MGSFWKHMISLSSTRKERDRAKALLVVVSSAPIWTFEALGYRGLRWICSSDTSGWFLFSHSLASSNLLDSRKSFGIYIKHLTAES
jgi:hypothetical protein